MLFSRYILLFVVVAAPKLLCTDSGIFLFLFRNTLVIFFYFDVVFGVFVALVM